jgi:hypothetical protein
MYLRVRQGQEDHAASEVLLDRLALQVHKATPQTGVRTLLGRQGLVAHLGILGHLETQDFKGHQVLVD